jgi:hypothetical protein
VIRVGVRLGFRLGFVVFDDFLCDFESVMRGDVSNILTYKTDRH